MTTRFDGLPPEGDPMRRMNFAPQPEPLDVAIGVAELPPGDPLPPAVMDGDPRDSPDMLCDLCGNWSKALWPLLTFEPESRFLEEWPPLVCEQCAEAIRPPVLTAHRSTERNA